MTKKCQKYLLKKCGLVGYFVEARVDAAVILPQQVSNKFACLDG